MAWLGFILFFLLIEHARTPIQRVWVQFFFPNSYTREDKAIWITTWSQCQPRESNPGRLRDKQVRYPLHHCLSGYTTVKLSCQVADFIWGWPDPWVCSLGWSSPASWCPYWSSCRRWTPSRRSPRSWCRRCCRSSSSLCRADERKKVKFKHPLRTNY